MSLMPTSMAKPTAPPSSIYTGARAPDPDDIEKVNLRKPIEHDPLHLVEDVQVLRDSTPSTHLSENDRSRVQRDYEGSDGRSEDGYRSTGAAHEGGEPDGSKESTEAGEGDTRPRQPHSHVSSPQPLHS